MFGALCLQGGREFTPACNEMDTTVVGRARPGPVAILAGAARVGDDYDGASLRARRHYEALGSTVEVVPDPRSTKSDASRPRAGEGRTLAALHDEIGLLVLPGGSPSGLLGVLSGAIRDRVVELYRSGCGISGASAGAMVLCERMARPDRGDITDGLGLVAGLALPHWSPDAAERWSVPDDVMLWGLPECGGVLIDESTHGDAEPRAVGQGHASRRRDGVWEALPVSSA